MPSIEHPSPPQDLSGITGHRFVYTYANGWQYEMYVKNDHTIDYRIHSGHVGGRWAKGQEVDLVQLDDDSFKISWTEPCFQNDHLDEMRAYRDEGPTYPIYVVPEFAYITLFEHVGEDDESVIDVAPGELPAGWAERTK